MLRVVVADDNPVIRQGLVSLLESTGRMVVVGAAADGEEAVALARKEQPDVVLLDVNMPLLDGVSAAGLLSASFPVLMLTHLDESDVVQRALRAGARGYLVHGTFGADELLTAIERTADGGSHLSPAAMAAAVAALHEGPAPAEPVADPRDGRAERYGLTPREVEVIELVARGLSNDEIAGALFVTPKTVKNYVNAIFGKLGVSSRAAAVAVWLGTARA